MNARLAAVTLSSVLVLTGCGEQRTMSPSALPVVTVSTAQTSTYAFQKAYTGRIQAVEDTDISAQVTGYLTERHFREGQIVEAGQRLYSIEPSAFEAQVASAEAAVAQANAALKKAELDHQRGKRLLPQGSISQAEFDALSASLLSAQAQVKAAQSQRDLAKTQLSYTQIVAPISGRIGASKASKGDLLSPNMGVLTTIVSLDPVLAAFNISERERLQFKIEGETQSANRNTTVELELENGQRYAEKGDIEFVDNRISLTTGTLAMRARFANHQHHLIPGQHARVIIKQAEPSTVLTVPEKAVQRDLEGNFVLVVDSDGNAHRRIVSLGPISPQGIIVRSGIKAGEQVITEGLQRVRDGMPVTIQPNQE